MKEEARSKVTRRDFIKDIGSGAIGTALISAGVLTPQAVEAAQTAGAARAIIPKDLRPDPYLNEIRKRMEAFRDDLKSFGVVHVNFRLNESETEKKVPFFVDWVGTAEAHSALSSQGLTLAQSGHRAGDPIRSAVYEEAVGPAPKIIDRDWCAPGKLKEKAAQSQLLGQRAGAMYQMFIGIKASQDGKNRCVGLLTAGFPQKLDKTRKQVEDKLKEWAGWTKTQKDLVSYIAANFSLGGPIVK
jgi:hypothetical protein